MDRRSYIGTLFFVVTVFFRVEAQTDAERLYMLNSIKEISQKIQKEPDNLSYYFARAIANYEISTSAAIPDFKKVEELYSANPVKKNVKMATDACYYLADYYFFRNADRDKAGIYVKRGLSITPGDKRFEVLEISILGTYPEKTNEVNRQFEKLLSKNPNDEKIMLHFAKFLEKHNEEKSIQLYEKAVRLYPDNKDVLFALGSYFTNQSSRIFNEGGDLGTVVKFMNKAVTYFEMLHKMNRNDREIIEILIQLYGNLNMEKEKNAMKVKLKNMI